MTGGATNGPPPPPPPGNITTGTSTTPNITAATATNPPGTNAVATANQPANPGTTTAAAANAGNQPAAPNAPNQNVVAPPGNLVANANPLLPPKPTPIPGPFYSACKQFPITNLIAETTRLNAMYAALFHQDPLTPNERAMAVCAQPGPLPLLAITKTSNTATILHCLTIFYPPLGGYQGRHPATGLTLALVGEAMYPGGTPDIVSIPDNAFADAQAWHAATVDELAVVDPLQSDLLPPSGQNAVTVSRIIPLPPFLVPFFIDNTNLALIQLCKKFCTTFSPNDPQTFQASTLTRQFLLAAATTDPTLPATTDSQLAINLPTPTRDNILAQWAMGRYSGYHFLTTRAIQHPPPTLAGTTANTQTAGQNQPTAPGTAATTQANGTSQQNTQNAAQLGNVQLAQAQQPLPTQATLVDITDDDSNAPPAQPQPIPLDPVTNRMVQVVAASVSDAVRTSLATQRQNTAPTQNQLEAALTQQTSCISGVELSSLISWSGVTDVDQLSPFWPVFDHAKTTGTRQQVLTSFLKEEFRHNPFVRYTVRLATVRDIKALAFKVPHAYDTLTQGISPFALHRLSTAHQTSLYRQEQAAEQASHTTVQDVLQRQRTAAKLVVEDHHMFMQLVATFRALTLIILGEKSPLFLDADELYKIALSGLDSGRLEALRTTQPDWYAHVLWAVTGYTREYFEDTLSLDQIERGAQLPRPFTHINAAIKTFSTFTHPDTADELKPRRGPANGKRTHGGQEQDSNANKRTRNGLFTPRSFTLPEALATLRQTAQTKVSNVALSRVLREGGSNIQALIRDTGVPDSTCCRLLFWGTCAEPACKLSHDTTVLTPEATARAAEIIQPGVNKLKQQGDRTA